MQVERVWWCWWHGASTSGAGLHEMLSTTHKRPKEHGPRGQRVARTLAENPPRLPLSCTAVYALAVRILGTVRYKSDADSTPGAPKP